MGSKDYDNFNKSYSSGNYHGYDGKNSESSFFKTILTVAIIFILVPPLMYFVYISCFQGEKSFDDFFAKYILGKNIDEEKKELPPTNQISQNSNNQLEKQNDKPVKETKSNKSILIPRDKWNKFIPYTNVNDSQSQNKDNNSVVLDSESKSKNVVNTPVEPIKHNSDEPDQTPNISWTPIKKADLSNAQNSNDSKKETNVNNSNDLNEQINNLKKKRKVLSNQLKDLGNNYKNKIIELTAKGLNKKDKEFKEYESNYIKELNEITKEIRQNIQEEEELNKKLRAQKSEEIKQNRFRLGSELSDTAFEKRYGMSKEEADELKNKIDKLYNDFMQLSQEYASKSEAELIAEHNKIIEQKKELFKKGDFRRLLPHFHFSQNFEIPVFVRIATEKDYPNLMENLLENGFSPNNWGFSNFPSVFYVAEKNAKKCVDVLLKRGVDLKKKIEFDVFDKTEEDREKKRKIENWYEDKTLLHTAAQIGHMALAEKVLEAGVPLESVTKDGKTPLYFAVMNNQYELAEFLIKKGAIVDEDLKKLTTNKEMIGLLEKASGSDSPFETSNEDKEWKEAYECIVQGKLIKLFEIYQKGKDLSKMRYKGVPAPCIAVRYDKMEILKFLTHEYDCNKLVDNEKLQNALHYAVIDSNIKIVEFLLNNGFDVNAQDIDGNTPLHFAIVKSFNDKVHNDLIDLLISRKADVNKTNKQRQTPLHISIEKNNYSSFSKLLGKIDNVNKQDINGNTPLHYAINNNTRIIASELLKAKANIDSVNLKEQTPLHLAVMNDNVSLVRFLLEKNADLNKQDISGNTPLHYVALFDSDNKDMLDEFNKYKDKFKLSIKNNEGKTPCNVGEINPFMNSEIKAEN